MPSFLTKNPALISKGPIIPIKIGLPKMLRTFLTEKKQPIPSPIPVNALIDTGASFTGISQRVAKDLSLTPHGVTKMLTAGEPTLSNLYEVYIDIGSAFKTHIILDPLRVSATPLIGQTDIDCLIGRDLLRQTVFIYIGYADTFSLSL